MSDCSPATAEESAWQRYLSASRLAAAGDLDSACQTLYELTEEALSPGLEARVHNDLGVIAALRSDWLSARQSFHRASSVLPDWAVPQQNSGRLPRIDSPCSDGDGSPPDDGNRRARIAILSLLFNWPSTGGGTVHTAETARFLTSAGYKVRHFVVRYGGWQVGQVTETVDWPIEFLDFTEQAWRPETIQQRVRNAVERFAPDHVIVTDSWNFKPRLAEALQGYSYFLRLAAQECLCPLNNVRLLGDGPQGWRSCPRHQLATAETCRECVQACGTTSGLLHRAERELAGFEEPDYAACLRRAFAEATGVLVVNPLIAECVKPHARSVHVLPSGFDSQRFPLPQPSDDPEDGRLRLLFAGLVEEPMKGFAVLHAACGNLWAKRQDFRLLATAEPVGSRDAFTEFVGWHTQAELPQFMRDCDVVVCPTVAEEALGRTAVEAMGAGRPVVASRIGGLPFTVLDEATGLLCAPGDPDDLARTLERLLDDDGLRRRLGQAGRHRFEECYTWDVILPQYERLLGVPVRTIS